MTDTARIDEIPGSAFRAETFRRDYIEAGRPAVVRGCFEPEAIFSLDGFIDEMRGREVVARQYGRAKVPKWQWRSYGSWHPVTIGDYLTMVGDGRARKRDIYLGQVPMDDIAAGRRASDFLDGLGRELGIKRLYSKQAGNFWIGPTGHTEPLHTDEGDGTLLQIQGSKRAVLFPASQVYNLYPFPLFSQVAPWVSQVDLDAPDLVRFPRLATALRYRVETVIGPGDMLFIPSQWHHEVTTIEGDLVVSVNRLWGLCPWRRNFRHPRSVLWLVKRQLPVGPLTVVHGWMTALKSRTRGRPAHR